MMGCKNKVKNKVVKKISLADFLANKVKIQKKIKTFTVTITLINLILMRRNILRKQMQSFPNGKKINKISTV